MLNAIIKWELPPRWCNGKGARLECGRSWVRSPAGSTKDINFAASPLSTQHNVVRARTGRPRVRIMCLGKVYAYCVLGLNQTKR